LKIIRKTYLGFPDFYSGNGLHTKRIKGSLGYYNLTHSETAGAVFANYCCFNHGISISFPMRSQQGLKMISLKY
jgi:hypothetical protein